MIVITAELWPKGDFKHKKSLGTMFIVNTCAGDLEHGEYRVQITKSLGRTGGVWRRAVAEVKDFPRQKLGVWDLLLRSLKAIVGDRNP